jgi:hypothetical protein
MSTNKIVVSEKHEKLFCLYSLFYVLFLHTTTCIRSVVLAVMSRHGSNDNDDSTGSKTGTNLGSMFVSNGFFAQNAVKERTTTNALGNGASAGSSLFAQVLAGAAEQQEVPTGTNLFTVTGTGSNWFGSKAAKKKPVKKRSPAYYLERKYLRQIAYLQQQLDEARQQKATTVGETLLTQFSRVAETTALHSALEM